MRQQLRGISHPLSWQARKNVLQVSIWIMPIHARRLDQTHDRSCPLAAAKRPGEQPVRASKRPWPYLIFDRVIIYGHSAVLDISSQCHPALEAVIQSFGDCRPFGHKVALGQHLGMQCVDKGRRFFLTYSPAIFVGHFPHLPFYFLQAAN